LENSSHAGVTMKNPMMFVFALALLPVSAQAEVFGKMYKVICPNSPEGCACHNTASENAPAVARFTMYQGVPSATETDEIKDGNNAFIELQTKAGRCFMPRDNLRAVYWPSDICPNTNDFKKLPFAPIKSILRSGTAANGKIAGGKLFPTFYNVAEEATHPGEKTEVLYASNSDTVLAKVSKNFRDALDLEGTGLLNDGRVLNVGERTSGFWKYVTLPKGSYGLGIHGHYLFPYRVAAVDFPYLCKLLKRDDCADVAAIRKKLVGTLLFFPKFVGLTLPNGQKHDGYICAHDIGGAIKNDRIDLFVGTMGGGNPFYAPCQQPNAYNEQGINSLVSSDWKSWKTGSSGKFERVDPFEYRKTVPQKGLEFSIVKDAFCKPLF
jgi:hypothetical protein